MRGAGLRHYADRQRLRAQWLQFRSRHRSSQRPVRKSFQTAENRFCQSTHLAHRALVPVQGRFASARVPSGRAFRGVKPRAIDCPDGPASNRRPHGLLTCLTKGNRRRVGAWPATIPVSPCPKVPVVANNRLVFKKNELRLKNSGEQKESRRSNRHCLAYINVHCALKVCRKI